jgi:hypothetical protein
MTLNIVRPLLLVGLVLSASAPGLATLFPYDVTIDTTSLTGDGGIYFQFNPGADSAPASAVITDFQIGGAGVLLPGPPPFPNNGDVTGSLDSPPLTISNTEGLNDYLHMLTFGTGISFRVTFGLPDDLTGYTSGSTFSFGVTADDGISPLLTDDPNGFIGQIVYDELGAFTVTELSEAGSINPVPEPASLTLVGLGLAAGLACLARRLNRPLQ